MVAATQIRFDDVDGIVSLPAERLGELTGVRAYAVLRSFHGVARRIPIGGQPVRVGSASECQVWVPLEASVGCEVTLLWVGDHLLARASDASTPFRVNGVDAIWAELDDTDELVVGGSAPIHIEVERVAPRGSSDPAEASWTDEANLDVAEPVSVTHEMEAAESPRGVVEDATQPGIWQPTPARARLVLAEDPVEDGDVSLVYRRAHSFAEAEVSRIDHDLTTLRQQIVEFMELVREGEQILDARHQLAQALDVAARGRTSRSRLS